MTEVRPGTPKSVSPAGELDAERAPLETRKSYLTLSARPEVHEHDGGASAVDRLDRILRAERDPITPELLREKLARPTTGLRARLRRAQGAVTEAELRALWGDR